MAQLLLVFLSPVIAFPFVMKGIKNRNKYSIYVLCIIMGIVAYCTIPLQDLFRHLVHYENYSTCRYSEITFVDFELNGIIVYLYALMGVFHIPFDLLRFFTISISFLLLYKIFIWNIDVSNIEYDNTNFFRRFLILLLFYDIFYTIAGVRYGFAMCIYLYGIHLLIDKNKMIRCFLVLVLASLFHFSFLFFSVASIAIYQLNINKTKFIIISIIAFVAMSYFFARYSDILGVRKDWYESGSKVTSYSYMTTIGFVFFFLPKLCAVPYVIFLLKNFETSNKWMKMGLSWLVLSVITLSNAVFFYRIWWVFQTLGLFMFLGYESKYGIQYREARRFLICSFIFFLFELIPMHPLLTESNYSRLFKPAPLIFLEHYTVEDVLRECPNPGGI